MKTKEKVTYISAAYSPIKLQNDAMKARLTNNNNMLYSSEQLWHWTGCVDTQAVLIL